MPERLLTIVTGASQNHARALFHLLESLDRYEPATTVVVYDLGLAPKSAARLRRAGRHLVRFRFEDYPPHVDPDKLKTYAWKPAIVREMLRDYGPPLLWLDAGDLVHERLDRVRAEMTRTGFYSPHTQGTIAKWCYPAAMLALGIEPEVQIERNRCGAVIGLAECALAREIADAWYEQSMRPEAICPPGSTTSNHRFDQTILGVVVARAIRRHGLDPINTRLGISQHNDELSGRAARRYMRHDPGMKKELGSERLWRAVRRQWRTGVHARQRIRHDRRIKRVRRWIKRVRRWLQAATARD